MSAPVVTGIAALLLSYFSSLTIYQVKDILLKSVFIPEQMVNMPHTKTPVPFKSLSASGGIVNAYNAVKMAIRLTDKSPITGLTTGLKQIIGHDREESVHSNSGAGQGLP
jgi:Subtilase family